MKKIKNSKKGTKRRIALIIVILCIFMASVIYGYYLTEYSKKPIVKEKINNKDMKYLYNFYVIGVPNVKDRMYYGNSNTTTTIIAFIDPSSQSSKYLIKDIFPSLRYDFINTGKIKFYNKNHITLEDYNEKTETFIYAQSLYCFSIIKKERYYDIYFDLFELNNSNEIKNILSRYNISEDKFNYCFKNNESNEILEDISEVDNYGITGIEPKFYIGFNGKDNTIIDGIPSYAIFKRNIRNYLIQLGD